MPRRYSGPLLLLFAVLAIGCGNPDTSTEDGVSQRVAETEVRLNATEGGALLLEAIDAHGGLEAWYAAPTSSYTWEYANEPADLQFKSFLVADNETRRVYHDLLTVGAYGNPRPVEARFAWTGEDAWMYPDSIESVNPRFWATTGYYFEQIPFILSDPGTFHERMADEELDGEMHDVVRVTFGQGVGDSPGDAYTLLLDKETGLVNAIRYTVTYGRDPDPDATPSETLFYYEDYVTVDGLTVATHFMGYDAEEMTFKNEAWADSISFRRRFDPSRLEAPDGARFVPAPN
ncbi:MAG: hypothetical protein WD423_03955 [Rhodothermales bacterium]